MSRIDGRENNEIRNIKVQSDYIIHADGSVFIEFGNTKVICTATVEEKVPPFLKGTGKGWISSEYSMLPASTRPRKTRDSSRGKIDGRTQEIQRLIGRSLRSVTNLDMLGERTIWIDCDVVQADGGTRTTSITGSFIALAQCIKLMKEKGIIKESPISDYVAAISLGIVEGNMMVDLCYLEDSKAQVDMNLVMTEKNRIIEIQGTGEQKPFSMDEFNTLIKMGTKSIEDIIEVQKKLLGNDIIRGENNG